MNRPRSCGLLISIALVSGCATYGGSRRTAKVGAAVVLAGAASMALGLRLGGDVMPVGSPLGTTLLLGGAFVVIPGGGLLAASGLVGMGYHALYPQTDEPRAPAWAQAKTNHLDDQLGLAIEAARGGDCRAVGDLATAISRENRDYYCNSFLRVPDLERCASVVSPCVSPSSW